MEKLINFLICAMMALTFSTLVGQDCGNPAQLCAEQASDPQTIDTVNPLALGCFNAQNTNYYFFTTNNNTQSSGTASINISNIDCPGAFGPDTIQVAIFAFDQGLWDEGLAGQPGSLVGGTDCATLTSSFAAPGDPPVFTCWQDTTNFSVETPNLESNTTYVVVVGNNQPTSMMDCGYNISISGPAVDINACCDGQVTLGEGYQIGVLFGDEDVGYNWTPEQWLDDPTIPNPTSYPEYQTTYMATGNVGGCVVTDVVLIQVGPPLIIYNTFTPNGDEINDTWEIGGINRFDNAQVTIFDRWGQIVFKSLGYAEWWDGTQNGGSLPAGTYYYVIELNSLDVKIDPITGFVTMLK